MPQDWVYDRDSFYDFLGFAVQCAPDFPVEDFLESDEQLDNTKAFHELRKGLAIIRSELSDEVFQRAEEKLTTSLRHFEEGDEIGGSHALQEVDRLIFGRLLFVQLTAAEVRSFKVLVNSVSQEGADQIETF